MPLEAFVEDQREPEPRLLASVPTQRAAARDGQLDALDALRAFAAVAVLLAHTSVVLLFQGSVITWLAAGDIGVSVFFVLSGFLISRSILRQRRTDVRGFMVRRAFRILPLYYASILLTLVLVDSSPLTSAAGRADIVAHVFMVHGFFRGMRYSMNGVWWTLTIEWFFYLFMGLVAPVFRRRRWGWWIAIGMIVLGLAWRAVVFATATSGGDVVYLVQQLPGMADLFGVGMLLALIGHAGWLHRAMARAWARGSVLLLSSLAVMAMLVFYNARKPTYWTSDAMVIVWPLVFAVGIGALVAGLSTRGTVIHTITRVSGLAFLGTVSYGIYLFHPLVISIYGDHWLPDAAPVAPLTLIFAVLAGAVLISTALYYALERPAMTYGRRVASRPVRWSSDGGA